MTNDEKILIETQFKSLADLFEVKLKASEDVICGKVTSLEEKFEATKVIVDNHIYYYNSFNRKIVRTIMKSGVILFILIIGIVLILGFKDNTVVSILTKIFI